MSAIKSLLHLSLIPKIGPATILKIIEGLRTGVAPKFSKTVQNRINSGLANKTILEEERAIIKKYNITVIDILDDYYPEPLKNIYHPPIVLYIKGKNLKPHVKRIAIVGSRNANEYAKKAIEKIVPPLVKSGFEIVSGGALGVDTMAHKITLECGGITHVVFGSGLTHPYPSQNKEFFRKVVKSGGTLISPFPLRTTPSRGTFPARNRVVAGLAQGCIVIQAAKKSGALITAQFALDQGKQVFALPGPIDDERSAGCHRLIQDGAKLVFCADDIFEEFGISDFRSPLEQEKSIEERPDSPIIALLTSPHSIDELVTKTNLSVAELQQKLFELQLEGKVTQNFAGLWQAK
jgi:DNA processing protein